MYSLALLLHSWLRWLTVAAGLGATVTAFTLTANNATSRADRWSLIFSIALDVQLLLGLLLYFVLSPTTAAIFDDFGGAMRDPVARFWAVEHLSLMLVSVIAVHVGRVLARKAPTPESKRLRLAVCMTIATVAMLAAIPWPGMRAGRPFFRG
jgi:hypothetical protein